MPKKSKSVQIRFPTELATDIGIVAHALGKSVPEYAEEVMRAAVTRDMPHAAKVASQRAEALKKKGHPKPGQADAGED